MKEVIPVKDYTSAQLFSMLAIPATMVIFGLMLLLIPVLAPAMAGALTGFFCILAALALGAGVFFGSTVGRISRGLWALVFLALGLRLLMDPLAIARFLGRGLGILLILQGAVATVTQIRRGSPVKISRSLIFGIITLVAGAVLVFLPLISSRIFFRIVGILLIGLGTAKGADNFLSQKPDHRSGEPRFIDVEKL